MNIKRQEARGKMEEERGKRSFLRENNILPEVLTRGWEARGARGSMVGKRAREEGEYMLIGGRRNKKNKRHGR